MQDHNNKTLGKHYQLATNNVILPLDYACQIYPRVSTPEQIKNVSAEMQKDKSFAVSCGWRDDEKDIIVDTRDLGVSGQVRMEDRLAFNEMLRRIANGLIKAVVVVNVDRLFRNKWGDESGKFMEICFRYGVIVVTPDFVYDFRISWHIDRFKRRCEEAWNYLEYHVYGRLHPAQDARGYAGYWTGGNVAMGLLVDTRERIDGHKNPNFYRYIVYEPHAEVVRWIFRTFKRLNGNVTATMVEIEKKPVLFPDFDESIDPFIVNACYSPYTKVDGGYTIVSDRGLRNILVNRVYIGYWIYKKEVMSTENHPAIVDPETFTYAYNRLSKTKIDGTPNEQVIEYRKRYIKRHFAEKPAILKECIQAEDPKVKIYVKDCVVRSRVVSYYGFYPERAGNIRQSATSMIVASQLDNVVLQRLREHMHDKETQQKFQDFTSVENEVLKEVSETLKDIQRDIEATKALMKRIKAQIKSGKLTNPDLLEEANESYSVAQNELKRLEEREGATTQIAREDEERRTFKALMNDVNDAWEEIVFPEDHPWLVHLFIKSVTLTMVSPSFFSVAIEWRDSTWGVDRGLCYKGTHATSTWTEQEIATLIEYYATTLRSELIKLLPRRSFSAMQGYVTDKKLGLKRKLIKKEEDVPYYVCLDDWKIMQQYKITELNIKEWDSVKLIRWDFLRLWINGDYRGVENRWQVCEQERNYQPTLYIPRPGFLYRTSVLLL